MNFLRRLFGTNPAAGKSREPAERAIRWDAPTRGNVSDRYFLAITYLEAAYAKGDFEAAREIICDTLPDLHKFVRHSVSEYGTFDIRSVPVLEKDGRVLAVLEDRATLQLMIAEVERVAALKPWRETVSGHLDDLETVGRILETLSKQPEVLQKKLKKTLGIDDGRRLSTLVGLLDKCGRIRRRRITKTYALTLPNDRQPI